MKKVFQRFILLFLAVITTMLFTACASHTHTFSEEWTYNATEHWHQATCEHKNEISEKGEHTFGGWTVKAQPTETSEGLEERSCSVCGYKETRVVPKTTHVHTFSDEWSFNETEHWHNATCDHKDVVSEKAAHTYGDWEIITEAVYGTKGSKSHTCTVCGYEEIVEIPARNYFIDEEAITLIEACFDARDAVISFSLSRGDFTDAEIISIKDQKVKIAEKNRVIYFANKAGSLYKYSSENNFYETALNNEADLRLATKGINATSILNYIMDSNLDMHEYLETSDFSFTLNEDGSYSITHTADTEAIKGSLAYFIEYATYVKFNELSLEIGGSLDIGATYKLSINLDCEYVTIPEHTHIYSEDWSYDAEGHYHEALCPDGEEKHDLEAHTFGEWVIVTEAGYNKAGSKKHVCEVCGYEEIVEIPARDYYLDEELLELIKNQFNSNVRRGVIIDRKEESVVEVLCYNNIFKVIYSFKDNISDSYNKYTDDAVYTYESSTGYYEEKYDGLPADVVKKLFTLGGVFNTLTESNVDFDALFTKDKFDFEYDKENDAYKVTRKDVDDLTTYEDASKESADFLQYYIDITKLVKFVDDSIVFVCNDEHSDYVIALGLNEIDEIVIPEHTHAYEENWQYDETSHWHNPICPDGEEKHELESHTFGEWEVTIEATETKAGEKKHTCDVCGYTETEVIPMTGEVFSNFVWAADYKSALAVYLLGDVEHAYPAKVEETSVTYCDKEGKITYTATHGDNTDNVQLPLPATGHNWDTPTYVWNDDNTKVTATRVCKNDNTHVETETVDVVVSGGATCTEAGDKVFTASFTKEGFETQTKTVREDAFGHNCDIVFVWADDLSSATVKLVCKNDNTHIFELTDVVTVTSEVTTPSTCTKKGTITYTATVTISYPEYKAVGEFSENKTKEAELKEHDYSFVITECSFDPLNNKATVKEKCSVCGDEKTTELTLTELDNLTDGDLVLVRGTADNITYTNTTPATLETIVFAEKANSKVFMLYKPTGVEFPPLKNDVVYAVGYATTYSGMRELAEGCFIAYVDAPKFTLTLPDGILFDGEIDGEKTNLTSGEYVNGTNFKFGAVSLDLTSVSRYILLNGMVLVPDNYGVYEFNISEDTTIEVVLKDYMAVSKYVKANNADYLYDGMEVVFANETNGVISGNYTITNNNNTRFIAADATFTNGIMDTDATFPIIKLIKDNDKWVLSVNGNKYIQLGASGGRIPLVDDIEDATKWTISFDEGNCFIECGVMSIRSNNDKGFFTNYTTFNSNSTYNQNHIQLYVYTENYNTTVINETAATCEHDGYHASYKIGEKYYNNPYGFGDEIPAANVVIPALGHQYPLPADVSADSWKWNDERTQATLTLVCGREGCEDEHHELVITVTATANDYGVITNEGSTFTATITVGENVYTSIKSSIKEKYSVTIVKDEHVDSVVVKQGETVLDDLSQIDEGTELTVIATATSGYLLNSITAGSSAILSDDGVFTKTFNYTLNSAVTITFNTVAGKNGYKKVTTIDAIDTSSKYIFVEESKGQMNGTHSGALFTALDAVIVSNMIFGFDASYESAISFENAENGYYVKYDNKYLLSATNANNVTLVDTSETATIWTISFSEGNVLITSPNQKSNKNYVIQYNYNNGNPRFTQYNGGQTAIQLYKYVENQYVSDEDISTAVTPLLDDAAAKFAESYDYKEGNYNVNLINNATATLKIPSTCDNIDLSTNGKVVITPNSGFENDIEVTLTLTISYGGLDLTKDVTFTLVKQDGTPLLNAEATKFVGPYSADTQINVENNIVVSFKENFETALVTIDNVNHTVSIAKNTSTTDDVNVTLVLTLGAFTKEVSFVLSKNNPKDKIDAAKAQFAESYDDAANVTLINGVTVKSMTQNGEAIALDDDTKYATATNTQVSFKNNPTGSDVTIELVLQLEGTDDETVTVTLNKKNLRTIVIKGATDKVLDLEHKSITQTTTVNEVEVSYTVTVDNDCTFVDGSSASFTITGVTSGYQVDDVKLGEQILSLTANKYTIEILDETNEITIVIGVEKVVDILTYELIGVTGTSYTDWSDKHSNSYALYSGKTAKNNDGIAINAATSGIYSATTGGKLYSIKINWVEGKNTKDRKVSLYVSNDRYLSVSESGTIVKDILVDDNSKTVIDGDYSYFCIIGSGSAVYISSIEVSWVYSNTVKTDRANYMVTKTMSLFEDSYSSNDEIIIPEGVTVSSNKTDVISNPNKNREMTITLPNEDTDVTLTFSATFEGENSTIINNTKTITVKSASSLPTFTKISSLENLDGASVIIVDGTVALKNTISSNRSQNATISVEDNAIKTNDNSIVWLFEKHYSDVGDPSTEYWTIYNSALGKYLGGTKSKNQMSLKDDFSEALTHWKISISDSKVTIENIGRASEDDPNNKYIRHNGNSGWACYSSSTGQLPYLYVSN